MSLEGNLKDFSLLEVIKLLSMGKKTGSLKIKFGNFEGKIWVRDGLVIFAESPYEKGAISSRLVKDRKLSEKQLRQALGLKKIQKASEKKLGEILVSEKYIDEKQLEDAVKSQIMDSIFEIYLWKDGNFELVPDDEVNDELAIYPLAWDEIENEIVRMEKTWEAVTKKIHEFDVVFVMSLEAADRASEIRLKPIEWKILCFLDGTTSAREIGDKLGLSDFKLRKALYGLFSVGLIAAKGATEVEEMIAKEYFPAEEFK